MSKWEPAIQAFEAQDRLQPPPEGAALFVGSSSIGGWDLPRWFPDRVVINRGFGGSDLCDSVHFAERIILRYRPKVVVVYAGDNDIAGGKPPEEVAADFAALVDKVLIPLPHTRVVFIGIKPSLARWHLVDKVRQANADIMAIAATHERIDYVDVDEAMLGPDGTPRPELFRDDGLHMTDGGYEIWTSLVAPLLDGSG